jgi:hypothetical protein
MATTIKIVLLIAGLTSTLLVLCGCDNVKAINDVIQTAEDIKHSALYKDIKTHPLLSSLVLGLLLWVIVIIIINVRIKKVQLTDDEKKRISFIQLLYKWLRIKEEKWALVNRILTPIIYVLAVLVSWAIITIMEPQDNRNGAPLEEEPIIEISKLQFSPALKRECDKGRVLFSPQPQIDIKCAYNVKPETCVLFFCYLRSREAGHWIILDKKGKIPGGWKRGYPEFVQPVSPGDPKAFNLDFQPTAGNRLFGMDPSEQTVSERHLYIKAAGNVTSKNYEALRGEAWNRYLEEVLEKYLNPEHPEFELKPDECIRFFYPVHEVDLTSIPTDRANWFTQGQEIKPVSESGAIFIENLETDSVIRYINNDTRILYPFGARFNIAIDKTKRPSALIFCVGNRSPTFVEIKLQSLIGSEDKYKVVITEDGTDVTHEWLQTNKGKKSEWPINWEKLDIRLYAYSGKKILIAIDDGFRTNVITYEPKSEEFKNGPGSRFAFRIEQLGAEITLKNLQVFHFDPEAMNYYEAT